MHSAILTKNVPRKAQVDSSTDDSTKTKIERALGAVGHYGLREIQVRYKDGEALLEGYVSTYYLKQMAQCATLAVPGVKSVKNRITVR